MTGESALAGYFLEARSWDDDRTARRAREVRYAWWVAAAGWLCAVGCAAALIMLMPLKRVEPFLVRVDNSTGIVDVVPRYDAQLPLDQSVTRFLLTHYIRVCERFNALTAESDYQECGAFNGAQRNQQWSALWARSNPDSPLNMHRDGSAVRAQVQSVSFFARANGVGDLVQVRYLKAERSGIGAAERVSHWIASLQYTYTQPATDPAQRSWNPLGLKVLALTAEPEIVNAGPTS